MRKTDREVLKLIMEHARHGGIGRAGRSANMDRKTASKYIRAGKLPSELVGERTWRTRPDPFEEAHQQGEGTGGTDHGAVPGAR